MERHHFISMQSYPLLLVTVVTIVTSQVSAISIEFTIDEEKPINTEVGNVAEKSRLAENRSVEDFNALRYSLLSNNDKHQSLFRLDAVSGMLYIDKVINRDEICSASCDLNFQVLVQSQGVDIIELTITINDINDNSPVFPQRSINIEIPEETVSNYAYDILVLAVDGDTTAQNSIVKYDYSPQSHLFSVNYTKLLSGDFTVKLIVKQPLDREKQAFYQIYLIAIDGGTEPRSDQMQLNISVTDINDNPPKFQQPVYRVTVKEDAAPNTGIINVTADDLDAGENGRVSYKLVTTNKEDPTISDLFRVDPNTGEIIILKSLKYTGEKYSIIVEATDHGKSPKTAQVGIEVSVEDSGNNAPVIKINVISSTGGVVSISENINIGGFVAHVSVEDSDTGDNGRVNCYLEDESHFKVEKITKGYKVVVKTKLNREDMDLHNVTVICHDYGIPVQMSSSESFRVKVYDENDNDPVFLKNIYEASIQENNTIGIMVVQVSAVDDDLGSNAQVQYFLHSDAGSNFAINSNTGVITASAVYDRETIPNSRLSFHVLAVDRGDPARTGTSAVVLNISDINDNSPKFNRSIFSFQVLENKQSDTVVGYLQAYDADKGENSRLSFEIAKEDELLVPFVVFQDGVIKTNKELDREQKGQYNFLVYVFDHGQPTPLSSSAYVTVFVTDSNDNDPIISFPNKKNSTVWATSGTTLPITTIEAYDIDEGDNKRLSFYIHSGNEGDIFFLHSQSGELFVNTNYRFTKDISARLVICVKDAGNPVRSKCAQLNAIVTLTNATVMEQTEPSNNYITISIVVIIVTVLVSIAIILTIVFLKKIDRNRQKQKYAANGPLGVPTPYSSSSPASSQHDVSSDAEYMERKKKEVTFSPSTTFKEMSEKSSLSQLISTDVKPGSYMYDTAPDSSSDPQNMQLKAFQLQQQFLKQKSNYNQETHRGHPGDNHSDTSQETTTSDSGRGNSEDDVPSSAMTTEDRSFDHSSYMGSIQRPIIPPRTDRISLGHNQRGTNYHSTPTQPPPSWLGYDNSDKRHYKISLPHPHGGNRSTPVSQYGKNTDNFVSTKLKSYVDDKLNSLNVSWNYQPNSNIKNTSIDKNRDYFNLGPGSISTVRSRDDDDDAATTTSGSYTVNPDDLEEEHRFLNRNKDYVV